MIEDYLDQVVSQLHYVCDEDFEDFSTQSKVDFFCEIRQTFGTSALLLEGGEELKGDDCSTHNHQNFKL